MDNSSHSLHVYEYYACSPHPNVCHQTCTEKGAKCVWNQLFQE